MKTPEELKRYIFIYKAELLDKSNIEKDKLFDRANNNADTLTSQLILISSILLTILGGLITANVGIIGEGGTKVLFTLTILFLLISIGFGLYAKSEDSKFWNKLAKNAHKNGRIILEDNSTEYEDLAALRSKIINSDESMPEHSPELPYTLQTTFFVLGLLILVTFMMILLYS
jgi:phosphoglycerol transferase MdoB-like AlkP superfamily enzyme